MIASLVSIFVSLWQLVTGLRHKNVGTQVADEANSTNKASAIVARRTASDLDKGLAHVDEQTRDDVARVRAAVSVRDERAALQDAIDRANRDV